MYKNNAVNNGDNTDEDGDKKNHFIGNASELCTAI